MTMMMRTWELHGLQKKTQDDDDDDYFDSPPSRAPQQKQARGNSPSRTTKKKRGGDDEDDVFDEPSFSQTPKKSHGNKDKDLEVPSHRSSQKKRVRDDDEFEGPQKKQKTISESFTGSLSNQSEDWHLSQISLESSLDEVRVRMESQARRVDQLQASQDILMSQQLSQAGVNGLSKSDISQFKVIGQVLPTGLFIVSLGAKFYFCNQSRVQERISFLKLQREFSPKFWRELSTPILVDVPMILKNLPDATEEVAQKCWDLLYGGDINPTLIRNGFKLSWEGNQIFFRSVYDGLEEYGIPDLVELLCMMIARERTTGLYTNKLRNHLLEIVRKQVQAKDMTALNAQGLRKLLAKCSSLCCPHGKPIFEEFYEGEMIF
eukprot:TRINITY_DN6600_c0_g1_i1.p1 TRINITY_DN6600_c0_g1~~TRINITY_DN6600_c0_g1_i1.p1  ORF type:complete len:376 (-),score=66.24 TRINITY_DN6600_c0_g1_i1:32-1159(-)